jgi:hypothetical protein
MVNRDRVSDPARLRARRVIQAGLALLLLSLFGGQLAVAHSPNVDSSLADWCVGAASNTATGGGRVEDSGGELVCGNCSSATNRACVLNSDCPSGQSCVNTTSKREVAWWDNRTDGAVNDLGTVAMTQDNTNLYIAAELWVDPDPVSLPFGEIAIDYAPGGLGEWHDPNGVLTAPGHCSTYTDRACTSDADCHFCQISQEPFPSTRLRTCGSACDPNIGDVCETDQVCVDLGVGGLKQSIGLQSSPEGLADYLLLFDFSLWLIGAGDATRLVEPGNTLDPSSNWDPVLGCQPDFVGDDTICDFPPSVNPGASGGSGGPPGSIEVAIPWSAFGCTGCPSACSCPGFGPGQPFRFTMTVARGSLTLDFSPDGAHEDVMSEAVAGTTTTTTDSCPGFGTGNTACELADQTADAYIPRVTLAHELDPGGTVNGLTLNKGAGSSIQLDWFPSCSVDDIDYGVYEGSIGDWTDHQPVNGLCMAGGLTATFTPGTGSQYYLIVPTNGPVEGSYGQDSASAQRPASTAPCTVQVLGSCP